MMKINNLELYSQKLALNQMAEELGRMNWWQSGMPLGLIQPLKCACIRRSENLLQSQHTQHSPTTTSAPLNTSWCQRKADCKRWPHSTKPPPSSPSQHP